MPKGSIKKIGREELEEQKNENGNLRYRGVNNK